ncbi:MAG: FkbM family methyltransferase [Phenylobacterium sp.]|uniref:FkbM family methyltransferase n=1 Tax=Phenylobacterium sp. TaxID=1871053 RepID=UPI002726514C|nr:FkbM family methyltransferase [Phenylobacterium sp.]MDO8911414.1 FkbM family methyltransferase [Phenylobacterium sp.]MDP3099117.1 FkbM family methyltransferase [Phenylobacterium sp.]
MTRKVLEALRDQGYEPASMLDVGANIGGFTEGFLQVYPDCVPTLVEPNPYCEPELVKLGFERHMVAASDTAGVAELFLSKDWLQSTGVSLYREDTHYFSEEKVLKHAVPKVRIDDLFAGRRFDFVKIDTQGAEVDVLKGGATVLAQADYILLEVSMVEYNIGGAKAEDVFAQLDVMGFHCAEIVEFHRLDDVRQNGLLQIDVLFERRSKRDSASTQALFQLGQALAAEGRTGEAQTVFENLIALRPHDEPALWALIEIYTAQDRTLDVLRALRFIRQGRANPNSLLEEIQTRAMPAIGKFNAHLEAGETVEAERYAAALVALIPNSEPMLTAAMSCNQVLKRWGEVERYARALLKVDPANHVAQIVMAAANRTLPPAAPPPVAADPALAEIAKKMALALAPGDLHPLLRLRDVHDVVSLILCRPLTPSSEAQIAALLAAAAALEVVVEPGSEWEGWHKHYRLLLDAVDLAAVNAPTPAPAPESELAFVSSTGAALDWDSVRATADRLGAQAVFFAAADQTYVDLYARWYALSVLKYSDVPSLIVIHVIGGKDQLAAIAAGVGISDERLIFAGDDFDAAAVTTKVYDAPPKGFIARPVAHFQCVRFQRLGTLLARLERPVFVSDIDLILQRGVADLLARAAPADVMFNENEISFNAGSRLTANLLLVNPTAGAQVFLAFLRDYIERELARPAVTRWIDQVALIFARHHLVARGPSPTLAYFDTTTDINNVMYPSYQANPFRFLSLFHGFDTSSLEGAGEGAAAQ